MEVNIKMTTNDQPQPVDPTTNRFLSGRFAPVHDELDTTDLRVEGKVPDDLNGTYMRNGPNPKYPPLGSYSYPLDGDGMVHAVTFDAGTVRYRNRFVVTPGLQAEERAGRALYAGILTPYAPDMNALGPDVDPAYPHKSTPFINVLRHDGRYLAFDEASPPFELTADLATIGRCDFGAEIPAGTCAHPRIDPGTGEMLLFTYLFSDPWLTWEAVGPDGNVRTPPTPVAGLDRPHMIHDFVITPAHLVLVVAPVVYDVDLLTGRGGDGSPIAWKPELGTRIAVIPRSGGDVRWVEAEAFWVWHFANAFADGDQIVVDFPWISHFSLHARRERPVATRVVRMTLDPGAGSLRLDTLDDRLTEFPRIDDRLTGRPHRYFHVAHRTSDAVMPGEWDALLRFDTEHGTVVERRGKDEVFGEGIFAPRDGSTGENDGYLMTFAHSKNDDTRWLLVLDAVEPVARIAMPRRVPHGLHGNWIPAA